MMYCPKVIDSQSLMARDEYLNTSSVDRVSVMMYSKLVCISQHGC